MGNDVKRTSAVDGVDERRFWSRVDKSGDCWIWKANDKTSRYGRFETRGQHGRRKVAAHRIAWELLRGLVPDGMELDHLCRNTRCVNPDHLEPVTHRVNVLRGEGICARRLRRTHCPHGHELTPENIRPSRAGGRLCLACYVRRRREECDRLKEQRARARAGESA